MVKSLVAGLLLAITASGASIQSLPDWEGHAGSLTLTSFDGPLGTGNIVATETHNFIVGPGPEVVLGLGSVNVNIGNGYVIVAPRVTQSEPSVLFSFVLNGPPEPWFNPAFFWGSFDAKTYAVYQAPGLVPEPATYAITGAGLGLLILLRRRKLTSPLTAALRR